MGFEADVKPMFSAWHRGEMDWQFDLWSYADVKARADKILERLEEQTMPCDVAWEPEKIDKFRVWVQEGCLP